jgi:hypothetical protein
MYIKSNLRFLSGETGNDDIKVELAEDILLEGRITW